MNGVSIENKTKLLTVNKYLMIIKDILYNLNSAVREETTSSKKPTLHHHVGHPLDPVYRVLSDFRISMFI